MPSMVRDLAASLNLKMAPSRCLKGGQTLKGHLEHKFLTETLADGGFPETTALYLQKIAGETVRDNLSLIGIKR